MAVDEEQVDGVIGDPTRPDQVSQGLRPPGLKPSLSADGVGEQRVEQVRLEAADAGVRSLAEQPVEDPGLYRLLER